MNTLPKDPVVHSFYVGALTKADMEHMSKVKQVLDNKLEQGDNTIDIKKLSYYCNQTELIARQYIAYLESQVYYQRKFIIINGAKEYEKIDAIRATAVQARAASGNQ